MQVAPTAEYRLCRSRNCHAATHVGCTADPGWQCAWCMKHHIPHHWLLQEVQWKPSWQLAADVLTTDSGESAIYAYKQTRLPPPKHTTPRQAPALPAGWCPRFCAFQLAHMHPDLNILPLGRMVIAAHPTDNDHYTLHSSTGSTVSVLPRRKIQQLYTLFKPHCTQLTFEEEVHALVARSLALRKPRKPRQRDPLSEGDLPSEMLCPANTLHTDAQWQIDPGIIQLIIDLFCVSRAVNCDALTLPLGLTAFHSENEQDAVFSAIHSTAPYAWPGVSLSLPEYSPEKLNSSLEQAIYCAHLLRNVGPNATVLVQPTRLAAHGIHETTPHT